MGNLKQDIPAGLALAAFTIPESLAYASLAGLPPVAGLYCYLVAGPGYALFGASGQLAVGPTSALSVLFPTGLSALAAGDLSRYAALAAATAIVFGLICVAGRLLRASQTAYFISDTILLGFKTGAALYIASTQLPKLFGLPGGTGNFLPRLLQLWRELPTAHGPSLAMGTAAVVLFLVLEKLMPRRPTTLFVVGAAIIATHLFGLDKLGIAIVGDIPQGLPHFGIPAIKPEDLTELVPLAVACFLLGFVETSSVARSFAQENGTEIDTDRELLALGAANLAVGVSQGYAVSGGMSQSAVNAMGGAVSPAALLVNSAAILLVLLFFTGVFKYLPEPVLAAIVLMAAKHLVRFRQIGNLRQVAFAEWIIALVAFFGLLIAGVLNGVLIAAAASLMLTIAQLTRPEIATLGFDAESSSFVNLANRPSATTAPGALILRTAHPWVYFNVENIRRGILDRVAETQGLKLVVLDFSPITSIDGTAAAALASIRQRLAAGGIALEIANLRDEVDQRLKLLAPEDGEVAYKVHLGIREALAAHGLLARVPGATPAGT
ncbi:SulP family inorganic anion transporter [Bosea sp. 2RAB26]|uniref:SulP family inorganic anion transporter n=1 Tax=Bosea sp. 2RAB26 TaxID=3237476 RepID=UPI003F8F4588